MGWLLPRVSVAPFSGGRSSGGGSVLALGLDFLVAYVLVSITGDLSKLSVLSRMDGKVRVFAPSSVVR